LAKNKISLGRLARLEIRIVRRIVVITSLEWWTWLVPPLASLLWAVSVVVVVVVEVGEVFMGFGAVVPRMSFIAADFAREVRTYVCVVFWQGETSHTLLLSSFKSKIKEDIK